MRIRSNSVLRPELGWRAPHKRKAQPKDNTVVIRHLRFPELGSVSARPLSHRWRRLLVTNNRAPTDAVEVSQGHPPRERRIQVVENEPRAVLLLRCTCACRRHLFLSNDVERFRLPVALDLSSVTSSQRPIERALQP